MSADADSADGPAVDAEATDDVSVATKDDGDVFATLADSPLGPGDDASPTERAIWEALDGVPDPHLPLSLVEMAMIYDVAVDEGGASNGGDAATVEISFPCMGCPAYEFIHEDIRTACSEVGVADVDIDVVWDPIWSKDMMPEGAKESLRASGIGI